VSVGDLRIINLVGLFLDVRFSVIDKRTFV
jgi:hypothetical protein